MQQNYLPIYVQYSCGVRKCIYSVPKKAIYGTLEASLLFWEKLSKSLQEMEYQINEYDWCVTNNTIYNKQCTILWNVNHLKTSHVEPAVVSSILAEIDVEYGNIAEMTITRGRVHK